MVKCPMCDTEIPHYVYRNAEKKLGEIDDLKNTIATLEKENAELRAASAEVRSGKTPNGFNPNQTTAGSGKGSNLRRG